MVQGLLLGTSLAQRMHAKFADYLPSVLHIPRESTSSSINPPGLRAFCATMTLHQQGDGGNGRKQRSNTCLQCKCTILNCFAFKGSKSNAVNYVLDVVQILAALSDSLLQTIPVPWRVGVIPQSTTSNVCLPCSCLSRGPLRIKQPDVDANVVIFLIPKQSDIACGQCSSTRKRIYAPIKSNKCNIKGTEECRKIKSLDIQIRVVSKLLDGCLTRAGWAQMLNAAYYALFAAICTRHHEGRCTRMLGCVQAS